MQNTSSETATQVTRNSGQRLQVAFELGLLVILAVTALAYPLCLPDAELNSLYGRISPRVFRQLLPWVSCGYSPLVLKESLLLTSLAAALFIYAWLKLRSQWLGLEESALGKTTGAGAWLVKPELWGAVFVLYAAASVAWSPVFQHSLQTWVLLAAGVGVAGLCRSDAVSARFPIKFMVICVGCGAILAALALLQHINQAPWLPRAVDPRNRLSSLIGHNTGLSSWLMFPLCFTIYFVFTNRRLWVRTLGLLMAMLFVLVIIIAQSRAVWVLAMMICLAMPLVLLRLHGRRFKLHWFLLAVAVFALIVAALSISPQTNPLARLPVTLGERITDHILNLDQLRRETRLRILMVSLSELLPKAPFFGTGLGSFAWEYPKAQGDYFSSHPDTWVGTTTRRTDLAHNDYLQVLTELGLVGVLLLAGCLFALAREVKTAFVSGNRFERGRRFALAVPSAAVAIHALVDFPMHVAPIAVVALMSAALSTRQHGRVVIGTDNNPLISRDAVRKATWAGLGAAVLIFSWLPWGWQAMVGKILVSDSYLNMGHMWLAEYRESDGKGISQELTLLDRARRAYREAIINNVFNGEAYEGQATAAVNRAGAGLFAYKQYLAAHEDAESSSALAMRSTIASDAKSAISIVEAQLGAGGLRYHYTYYLLGRAWRMLWELEKDKVAPGSSEAYKSAVESLRTSIKYNPADSGSIRELSDLLADSASTSAESRVMRKKLFELDPWGADELILQPALKRAAVGEISTAGNLLGPALKELPSHPRVMLARAWFQYYAAIWPPEGLDKAGREADYLAWRQEKLGAAEDVITSLPQTEFYKPQKQRLQLLYAAAGGKHQEAHRLASEVLEKDMWNREARAIYYWTQHKLFGGALKYEDSIEYYRTRAFLAICFMDNPEGGALSLGELTFRAGEKLTLAEARRMATFAEANNWADFLKKVLPEVRKDYPGDQVLASIAEKVSAQPIALTERQ